MLDGTATSAARGSSPGTSGRGGGPEDGAPLGAFAEAREAVPRRSGEARKAWRNRLRTFVDKKSPGAGKKAPRVISLKD